MKTIVLALQVLVICALLLSGRVEASPLQQRDSGHFLSPRAGAERGRILHGHPVPNWWPNYSRYRGQRFSSFSSGGNRIDADQLVTFKNHVAAMERIRGAAYRSNDLTQDEKQRISQPFENWSRLRATEQDPNKLTLAGTQFQQEANKLEELHNVLARFAPPI